MGSPNSTAGSLTTVPPIRTGRSLATVAQIAERYPAFSVSALRWLLFRRRENGLASAVTKIGRRRILIDVDAFDRWLDQHREGGVADVGTR
jgi:hypothetical protein